MPPWYIWMLFALHIGQFVLHGTALKRAGYIADVVDDLTSD